MCKKFWSKNLEGRDYFEELCRREREGGSGEREQERREGESRRGREGQEREWGEGERKGGEKTPISKKEGAMMWNGFIWHKKVKVNWCTLVNIIKIPFVLQKAGNFLTSPENISSLRVLQGVNPLAPNVRYTCHAACCSKWQTSGYSAEFNGLPYTDVI